METAQILTLAQIIDGDATCTYCDTPAVLTVRYDPEPDPEPVCLDHGLSWLDSARRLLTSLFAGAR